MEVRHSFLLAANVMNNIPMSVAFSSIVSPLPEADRLPAAYASIIGSNIGAYFTPLGALAGIMWSGILNKWAFPFPSASTSAMVSVFPYRC